MSSVTAVTPKVQTKSRMKPNPTNMVAFRFKHDSGMSYTMQEQEHDKKFIDQAVTIIKRLARNNREVHVNAFWDAVERSKSKINEPIDMRMLGAAFRRAAMDGTLTNSGTARKSDRFGSYWRTVWTSNVYVPRTKKSVSTAPLFLL